MSSQEVGAENEIRTRDPDLGKVVLYQLSYFRFSLQPPTKPAEEKWRPIGGSNPCYRRERAVSWTTRRMGHCGRCRNNEAYIIEQLSASQQDF